MKRSLRSCLALLVVAAVIFAPGWYGQGRSGLPRGADLGTRMLAPTFDEGTVARTASEIKPHPRGQHVKRFHPAADFAYLGAFMPGTLGLAFLWRIAAKRVRPIVRFHHSIRLSRAPPLLQLA
jgi:hypothetical protein